MSDETASQGKINPEIDARINQFIANNPKKFQNYQDLVTKSPERAIRSLILKDLQVGDYKAEDMAKREKYNKVVDAAVDEVLKDKKYTKIAENLAQKWDNIKASSGGKLSNDEANKLFHKDAKAALQAMGVDLRPVISAKYQEEHTQKAKGKGI